MSWPHIKTFVARVESDKAFTTLKCKTFSQVKEACGDPLLPAKLYFFIFVAKHVQSYLEKYQADDPMVPFLLADWEDMLSNLMTKILKKEIGEQLCNPLKMFKYEVKEQDAMNACPEWTLASQQAGP